MLSVSPSFNSAELNGICDAKKYIWKSVKQCHLVIKSTEIETMYRFCCQHLCVDAILLWKHCAEACTYALSKVTSITVKLNRTPLIQTFCTVK